MWEQFYNIFSFLKMNQSNLIDLKAWFASFVFFSLSFSDCEIIMKIIVFILTVGYTARRWYMLEKNKKE